MSTVFAQSEHNPFESAETRQQLAFIERGLKKSEPNHEALNEWGKQLAESRTLMERCDKEQSAELEKLHQSIATLPKAASDESAEIAQQRQKLQAQEKTLTSKALNCRMLLIQIDQISEQLAEYRQHLVEEALTVIQPPLWQVFTSLQELQPPEGWRTWWQRLWSPGLDYPVKRGLGYLALCALLGFGLRFYLRRRYYHALAPRESFSGRFLAALGYVFLRYLPVLFVLLAWQAWLMLEQRMQGFNSWKVSIELGWVAYLFSLVVESIFAPPRLIPAPISLLSGTRHRLRWYLRGVVLLLVPGVVYLLLYGEAFFMDAMEEAVNLPLSIERAYLFIVTLYLLPLPWLMRRLLDNGLRRLVNVGFGVGCWLVAILEIVGYHALAQFIFQVVSGSFVVLGMVWFSISVVGDFFDTLEYAHRHWQQKVRRGLGLKSDEALPGAFWLRLVAALLIWVIAFLVLLRVWGLPDEAIISLLHQLRDGFDVGKWHLVPANILFGIVLFALLIAVSRWFRRRLEVDWLNRTQLTRGGREAVATISWYLGISFALLAGLATAGVDIGSLAIIAGAFSVGIGFGLQHVVSNFIAGLILLFERPVRPGDWVVIGKVEGYVQKINIRSTRIQTFDFADVLVPNSELITQPLTNWMLHDAYGRVCIPVQVAYGAEPAEVKAILLNIANHHPRVLQEGPMPPKVLFMGFGESSLNFELRVLVKKADEAADVRSDINFAIDEKFKQAGIRMPFPHREVHLIASETNFNTEKPRNI